MSSTKIVAVGKFIGNFLIFLVNQGLNKDTLSKRLK